MTPLSAIKPYPLIVPLFRKSIKTRRQENELRAAEVSVKALESTIETLERANSNLQSRCTFLDIQVQQYTAELGKLQTRQGILNSIPDNLPNLIHSPRTPNTDMSQSSLTETPTRQSSPSPQPVRTPGTVQFRIDETIRSAKRRSLAPTLFDNDPSFDRFSRMALSRIPEPSANMADTLLRHFTTLRNL